MSVYCGNVSTKSEMSNYPTHLRYNISVNIKASTDSMQQLWADMLIFNGLVVASSYSVRTLRILVIIVSTDKVN